MLNNHRISMNHNVEKNDRIWNINNRLSSFRESPKEYKKEAYKKYKKLSPKHRKNILNKEG